MLIVKPCLSFPILRPIPWFQHYSLLTFTHNCGDTILVISGGGVLISKRVNPISCPPSPSPLGPPESPEKRCQSCALSTGSSSRTEAIMTTPCRCSSPRSAAAQTRGLKAALLLTEVPLNKRQTRGGRYASPGWLAAHSDRVTLGKDCGWRERLGECVFFCDSRTKQRTGKVTSMHPSVVVFPCIYPKWIK